MAKISIVSRKIHHLITTLLLIPHTFIRGWNGHKKKKNWNCDQKMIHTAYDERWPVVESRDQIHYPYMKKGIATTRKQFVSCLTQNKTKNTLRVDLRAITNKIVHPEYDWFGIATETNKYRLYIGKMTTSKSSINQFFSHIVRILSLLPLHRQRVLLAPFPLILLLATNKECFFPALYRLAMFSSESHSAHAQLSPHPSVENGNLLSRLLESDSLDILRKSKLWNWI